MVVFDLGSRGNHEGAGRGHEFVTSTIVRQRVSLKFGELDRISIGNVNVFRDWSHVEDIVDGYILLAGRGMPLRGLMQLHNW
jgi:GDPmannose 4,6-dehydratase